jgi:IS30 family transposase
MITTSYKQLTQPERYQIEALCKLDYSARSIAIQLERSNKTISNESRPFEGRVYCAQAAHHQSVKRSSTAIKTIKCHDEVKMLTRYLLLIGLSPE